MTARALVAQAIRLLLVVLFSLTPSRAIAALSSSDTATLTRHLETLSVGWDQTAVNESNVILISREYSSKDWADFFTDYFSSRTITDSLRNYLVYPTFFWFDDEVHVKLQTALSSVLWQRILRITADAMNNLATDPDVRNTLVHGHRFMGYFTTASALPPDLQEQLYIKYKDYISRYPQYFILPYHKNDYPYLGSLRVQVVINCVDVTPLTERKKQDISALFGLKEKKLQIWDKFSVMIIDNDGLDARQLALLETLYGMMPQDHFHLRFLSVFDFLMSRTDWSDVVFPIGSNSGYNNIFGIKVGDCAENQFPGDIEPYITDCFGIVAAHELNHLIDGLSFQKAHQFKTRMASLVARAGTNDLQYLRSQIGGSFFQTYPQEFFASIANEYFANSRRTFELALSRYTTGIGGQKYVEPLNQFLFFADVYSTGGNSTYFYTLDAKGNASRQAVSLVRNENGHITSLTVDGARYEFLVDEDGYIDGILSLPSLTITTPPKIISGAVGNNYLLGFTAVGGVRPYSWNVAAGALPGGLSLRDSGELTGIPTSAGLYSFTVRVRDVTGASATQVHNMTVISGSTLVRTGTLAHIAAGGGWDTTITVVNPHNTAVIVRIILRAQSGSSLSLPLIIKQEGTVQSNTASVVDRVLGAKATLLVEMGVGMSSTVVGWVEVLGSRRVGGHAVFRLDVPNRPLSEAVVLLDDQTKSTLSLPYDNSSSFVMGIALVNVVSPNASVVANVWDENGNFLHSYTINIPGNGHRSFELPLEMGVTGGRRGVVDFRSMNGAIGGLGLRFSPRGTFTSVPAITSE